MAGSGALLGLLFGLGLLLIWRSGPRAPRPRTGPRRASRRQQALSAAGLTGINGAQLVALQVALGVAAMVLVAKRTTTVATTPRPTCSASSCAPLMPVSPAADSAC